MHPDLLDYFSQELLYMRQSACEFARAHPEVAAHLELGVTGVTDPYVERLIEAFCLLSARTRIKLDAEFPRFAQRLLEVLQPSFMAPMPSAGVVRLEPDPASEDLGRGLRVPAGASMWARIPEHAHTPVQWRTTRDVVLWPLRIAEARLRPGCGGLPPGTAAPQARACLQLRLQALEPWRVEQLQGLDRLRVQVDADAPMASRLLELLHAGFVGCVVAPAGSASQARPVPGAMLLQEALEAGEGLLPRRYNSVHAHVLLQEYWHAPQFLHEFTIVGLQRALHGLRAGAVDIWLLLRDEPQGLEAWVHADRLALFCAPVINLFQARADRVQLIPESTEFHVVADRTRPLDHEIWAIDELRGQVRGGGAELCLRPLYQTLQRDGGDHGRYFSLRREQRVASRAASRWGTRTSYIGTETFVSLVDQFDAPCTMELEQVSVKAWLSNRDLPLLLARGDAAAQALGVSCGGVCGARLLGAPSPPRPPLAMQHGAWQLIRLLGAHHLPMAELDAESAAAVLRDWLGLFAPAADAGARQRIDALVRASMRAVTRRLPHAGPQVFARALEYTLEVDEQAFAPGSPLLFGMVLERVLGHYAPINTGTQMRLQCARRGEIWRGPVRLGARDVA